MLYLALAVFSSALFAVILRFAEGRTVRPVLFLFNYLACTVCGLIYLGDPSKALQGNGTGYAVLLGLIAGLLFLGSLITYQTAIRRCGVILAATFARLGVIIPTITAILLFGDRLSVFQFIGIAVALAAIILMNFDPKSMRKNGKHVGAFLLLTLVLSGLSSQMGNLFDKTGVPGKRDLYLTVLFAAASLYSLILLLFQKKKPDKLSILLGIAAGVPNYFSSRFLMMSFSQIPAAAAYPVYSVCAVASIAAAGILLFHEKLSRREISALVLIAAALVLLNL